MKLEIETNKWQTQAQAAKTFKKPSGAIGCEPSYIRSLMDKKKVDVLKIPEWGLELVARPLVIEAKGYFSVGKSLV